MSSNPRVTCLWFDTQAEQAASFYTGIFEDSSVAMLAMTKLDIAVLQRAFAGE